MLEGPASSLGAMLSRVRIAKRALDVVAASAALVLTLPLFPILGFLIYVDSGRPIFFRQRRAGELLKVIDKRPTFREFTLYKFRSMVADAEKATGPVMAVENDPRVTRVGRMLRKTHLDELPQLWNVLNGSMSLVGPRPHRLEHMRDIALAIPLFEERMRDVKPGLTGLAQISLGYSGHPAKDSAIAKLALELQNPWGLDEYDDYTVVGGLRIKLLYDLAYTASLERLSTFLLTDLAVILRTPLIMLQASGR